MRAFSSCRINRTIKSVQLNTKQCKSYILFDSLKKDALLLDPLRENIALYLSFLAYHKLTLKYVLDSHSHADHFSAAFHIKDLIGCTYVMHKYAPAPLVDIHVSDGDTLSLGNDKIQIIHTPGHTPDGISLYTSDAVFTGDTLLIGGCGRTDLSGGDPSQSYDSITRKLFALPGSTIVYPAHDYRFNKSSTIEIERTTNPRLAGKTRDQFIDIMNNLNLALPEKIMEALQVNTSASQDDEIIFPTYSQLCKVDHISANMLKSSLANNDGSIIVIDVREDNEFLSTNLPGLPGSINIPLRKLVSRLKELDDHHKNEKLIVVVCRAGVRSVTAASMLTTHGFAKVVNLTGGLIEYDTDSTML